MKHHNRKWSMLTACYLWLAAAGHGYEDAIDSEHVTTNWSEVTCKRCISAGKDYEPDSKKLSIKTRVEWISVKDRMPDEGLHAIKTARGFHAMTYPPVNDFERFCWSEAIYYMPLPSPPEEA